MRDTPRSRTSRYAALSVAALAAATLLLEGALLRLLAVAQFYHFAFLVVSLALLGFGASGTLLSLSRRLRAAPMERLLTVAGIGFAASSALAYATVNYLPFDSYSIAWDRRQLLYFILYYLALALPFICSGLGIGQALAASPGRSHLIYAANLLGSATGALLSLAALRLAGVPGAVLIAGLIGLLPAIRRPLRWTTAPLFLAGLTGFAVLSLLNWQGRAPLGMTISPYKGLAHALRYPGSSTIFGGWNAIARVDIVANAGTRQLPGLSYTYLGTPPPQYGLSLDADTVQPVTLIGPEDFAAAAYMPEAIAFDLRPRSNALVLEPGGGLGVLQALAGGAQQVTAVLDNRLVQRAITTSAPAGDIYRHSRVRTVYETARVFLQRDRGSYDVIFLPLTDAYRPVTSGAYSLAETYGLTVEAFAAALARLAPDGLLVATRWLQIPPSEGVRLVATVAEALERAGIGDPTQALVAYRGIQTLTVLVQPDGWSADELARVREFAEQRRYDLVWAPDIQPEEVNRFNRLPQPVTFQAVQAVLDVEGRSGFFTRYPFNIVPPTDNRPFFFHFFTWQQTPEVLATLGQTWQPFGGSGYLILLAMLALVLLLSGGLILAPLALPGRSRLQPVDRGSVPRARALAYFALLGLAFLFVEIPLIQRWILLLGHPTYAFAAVVVTLLLFSSLGSGLARTAWLPRRAALLALVLLAVISPWLVDRLTGATLGWPLALRAGLAALSLAPLATLMGLPFPLGLAWLEEEAPQLVPWAWAINGCASVVTSVLAAILALSYGFTLVLLLGAGAYGVAWAVLPWTKNLSEKVLRQTLWNQVRAIGRHLRPHCFRGA